MLVREKKRVMAALGYLERVKRHLNRDDVAYCRKRKGGASTTLDYERASDGAVMTEVQWEYGSEMSMLLNAIRELERLAMQG